MNTSQNNKINYVEFPARDFEATKNFFSAVFEWTFQDFGPDYCSFQNAGIDGGFFRSELSARSKNGSVLLVFYSTRLERTLTSVRDAGGSITKDIFSFPGGRRFHFTEPSGNEFAVWSDEGV